MSNRRAFIGGVLSCCAANAAAPALAGALSTDLTPLMGAGYRPSEHDEKGLWGSCERFEEDLAESGLLLNAPDLQAYTREVLTRLLGPAARDVRPYLLRDASFNASMFPNGMMLVHTGFVSRVHNEAQFASVLGHEAGHYYRKHSLAQYRNIRRKSAASAFMWAGVGVAAGTAAVLNNSSQSWFDIARAIDVNLVLSVYQFSRASESEADAYGIGLIAKGGYSPLAAAQVWEQLIGEQRRSAQERKRKYNPRKFHSFATHPPDAVRMRDLADTAAVLRMRSGAEGRDGAEEWRRVIAPYRAALLDEQIKLNDPGASLYLIESHAQAGWDGVLRYLEGEVYRQRNQPGDAERAAAAFAAAIEYPDAPAIAWRAHGYAQMKAGRGETGRFALNRYLELAPDAKDASMVQATLLQ